MNFTNPYPHTEHEVYSQTFLQTVSANIRFSSSDTQAEYWQKFREFSKKYFISLSRIFLQAKINMLNCLPAQRRQPIPSKVIPQR